MNFVYVLSREEAESLKFFRFDYVISITDPNSEDANINATNILRLKFYDINQEIKTLDGKTFYPMSEEDANKIVEFIRNIPGMFDGVFNIHVHCEAGISRSAGVAAAISKYLFWNDDIYFKRKIPNMHCYKLLLDKLMTSGIPRISFSENMNYEEDKND